MREGYRDRVKKSGLEMISAERIRNLVGKIRLL
jgi:hypothetical protein